MGRSAQFLLNSLSVLSLFVASSRAQSSTDSAVAACTACLLEAFNPTTLAFPENEILANKTITAAIVYETPYTDAQGRTVSIDRRTEFITTTEIANNETVIFSAVWETLGLTLTYPTTYVAYGDFGLAPTCTGTTSSIKLPEATDPARLVFPIEDSLEVVSNGVADYLESLHVVDNGTDLNACSWAVSQSKLTRRAGKLPIPFSRRANAATNATVDEHPPPSNGTSGNSGNATFTVTNPVASSSAAYSVSIVPQADSKTTAILLTDTRVAAATPIAVAPTKPDPPSRPESPPKDGSKPSTDGSSESSGSDSTSQSANTNTNTKSNPAGAIGDTLNGDTPADSSGSGSGNSDSGNSGSGTGNSGSGNSESQGSGSGSKSNNSPQVVNVGGEKVTVAAAATGATGSSGGVVIAGQTIRPGQSATVNGVAVAVPSKGGNIIIAGSSTIAVNPANAAVTPPTLTVGDAKITANPSGVYVVAPGVSLSAGGSAVTIGGSTMSIAPGGSIAVVNGVTQTLASNPTGSPVLTLDGQTITANIAGSSTAFVFGASQTLTPGGVVTVSGTTFSLPASGSAVVINGQTSVLGTSNPAITAPPVLTVNGRPITAGISGSIISFVIAPGTTLTPGGSIVVSGTTYSLPATGSVAVINGKTSTLGKGDSSITAAPALTLNGQTYSATVSDGKTYYDLGSGTTLTPGGIITVSGTRISLASDGSSLIVGSSTSKISKMPKSTSATTTKSSTSSTKTGDAVASGLGVTKKAGALHFTVSKQGLLSLLGFACFLFWI